MKTSQSSPSFLSNYKKSYSCLDIPSISTTEGRFRGNSSFDASEWANEMDHLIRYLINEIAIEGAKGTKKVCLKGQ
jgi:hypothetical protein